MCQLIIKANVKLDYYKLNDYFSMCAQTYLVINPIL